MQNSQIFQGQYSHSRGEESLFSFSGNVPNLSYSNAEFQKKNPEVEPPDPRLWEREGKLPPLDILSGYAPAPKYASERHSKKGDA